MIQTRRAQRSFGDGLIAEEVRDLHEEWMKHADQVLGDKEIVAAIYEALAKRHPQSRTRGSPVQAYPNAMPTFTLKACGVAGHLSRPEWMTLVHRQRGKSCNAIKRSTRPFVAPHTGTPVGLRSTKTRRLTRPNKSQRSAHAISEGRLTS